VSASRLGVEHETYLVDEAPEGTQIHRVNVDTRSQVFRLLGQLLIGRWAVRYWERACVRRLRAMLE
jgi:hypothetical protein